MVYDALLTQLAVYRECNSTRKTVRRLPATHWHWNWYLPLHPHCSHHQRDHRRSPSLCISKSFCCEVRHLLPDTLPSSSRPPAARALLCSQAVNSITSSKLSVALSEPQFINQWGLFHPPTIHHCSSHRATLELKGLVNRIWDFKSVFFYSRN